MGKPILLLARKIKNGVPIPETKGAFDLVDRRPLPQDPHVTIERRAEAAVDEVGVDEDEGLLHVEADGDDVHGVLHGELVAFLERELGRVEELFVVGEHDDEGDVEDFLEPSL